VSEHARYNKHRLSDVKTAMQFRRRSYGRYVPWICRKMSSKTFLKPKYIATVISIFSLVAFGFYSNEARKEVYFLCGNYGVGDSLEYVVKQLNTVNLSEYKVENIDQGKRITHSSKLNFHLVSCKIQFTPEEKVVSVSYG